MPKIYENIFGNTIQGRMSLEPTVKQEVKPEVKEKTKKIKYYRFICHHCKSPTDSRILVSSNATGSSVCSIKCEVCDERTEFDGYVNSIGPHQGVHIIYK